MTIEEFDKKHNRCPFCEWYATFQWMCRDCKHRHPYTSENDSDNFRGNELFEEIMRKDTE